MSRFWPKHILLLELNTNSINSGKNPSCWRKSVELPRDTCSLTATLVFLY